MRYRMDGFRGRGEFRTQQRGNQTGPAGVMEHPVALVSGRRAIHLPSSDRGKRPNLRFNLFEKKKRSRKEPR